MKLSLNERLMIVIENSCFFKRQNKTSSYSINKNKEYLLLIGNYFYYFWTHKTRVNESMDDHITYEAIKNGDIKAFELLFREFYPSMCVIAMRFVANQDAAEDIAQEAFIKLWDKRTAYEDIPSLKTFLYVSVKNLCFNHIRNKKDTIDYTSPEAQNKEAVFKNYLIEEEAYRIIENAVNALPPQSQKIVKMYLDGKQNKEIAEILNISVNSVKTLKYNALSTLRLSLKNYFYLLILFLAEK